MDGIGYLIGVLVAVFVLIAYYLLTSKKQQEKELLREKRDKKVIELCEYLMSEPNSEKEESNNESLH